MLRECARVCVSGDRGRGCLGGGGEGAGGDFQPVEPPVGCCDGTDRADRTRCAQPANQCLSGRSAPNISSPVIRDRQGP